MHPEWLFQCRIIAYILIDHNEEKLLDLRLVFRKVELTLIMYTNCAVRRLPSASRVKQVVLVKDLLVLRTIFVVEESSRDLITSSIAGISQIFKDCHLSHPAWWFIVFLLDSNTVRAHMTWRY